MSQNVSTSGASIGHFVRGQEVTSFAALRVGDLLAAFSPRFNAMNLAKVTWLAGDGSRAHLSFVDPQRPEKPRLASDHVFCVWVHDLGHGHVLHRAERNGCGCGSVL